MSNLAGHTADYTSTVWAVASGLGAAVVVAMYGLYRRAHKRRELEEAEAILAEDGID
jgi:hypothetical protein